jgi:hypothetical protein
MLTFWWIVSTENARRVVAELVYAFAISMHLRPTKVHPDVTRTVEEVRASAWSWPCIKRKLRKTSSSGTLVKKSGLSARQAKQ